MALVFPKISVWKVRHSNSWIPNLASRRKAILDMCLFPRLNEDTEMCISPRAVSFECQQPPPFPEEPALQSQVDATSALPAPQGEKGNKSRLSGKKVPHLLSWCSEVILQFLKLTGTPHQFPNYWNLSNVTRKSGDQGFSRLLLPWAHSQIVRSKPWRLIWDWFYHQSFCTHI